VRLSVHPWEYEDDEIIEDEDETDDVRETESFVPFPSVPFVEPWIIEHRKINHVCPELCQNRSTPFYSFDVGGCVSASILVDYIFCLDKKVIEIWTTEDEEEYKAFYMHFELLDDSELEIFRELTEDRELRLSVYPWPNAGPVSSQDEENRRIQHNDNIRRRITGSASSFSCFGGGGGGKRSYYPGILLKKISYRSGSLIDKLTFE